MSEFIQPGLHPDPDTLNSFIEGMLPEHERLQCLTHLAECPSCREVVYLAQDPLESEPLSVVPAIEKVPFWKRWLTPIPVLRAATAAGILVLSFALYQYFRSIPNAPQLVAMATHPAEPAAAPEVVNHPSQARSAENTAKKIAPEARISAAPAVDKISEEKGAVQTPLATPVTSPVVPPPAPAAPIAAPPVAAPRPLAAFDVAAANDASSATQTGIAGTITDPAGAVIAGAAVKLRPLTSPAIRDLTTDTKGRFNVAGLQPGQYELQVIAPGFQTTTKQVNLQPNQMARGDSTLSIGSVSESISVTAEAAQVQTSSGAAAGGRGGGGGGGRSGVQPLPDRASVTFSTEVNRAAAGVTAAGGTDAKNTVANQPPVLMLPGKLPAKMMAVSGKRMLAADSAGALFLSENSGQKQKWKTVKPVWHGKVVNLVALTAQASPLDPAFQLTTDSNAIWLSRDGSHWYAAPAQK
jgi:hypothetical protein